MNHSRTVLTIFILVLVALTAPGLARADTAPDATASEANAATTEPGADGWTWNEPSASGEPAPDGWTWDEAAASNDPAPDGWTWDEEAQTPAEEPMPAEEPAPAPEQP